MVTVFESIMLICFGLSWPISVYKSATSHSTKGKSVIFTVAIMLGYIAGIIGKIVGKNLNYTLVLYLLNLAFVTIDFILFFINRKKEAESKTAERLSLQNSCCS